MSSTEHHIDRDDDVVRPDDDSSFGRDALDELDQRPPPPPAAAAWPRDDVEVSPTSVGEPDVGDSDLSEPDVRDADVRESDADLSLSEAEVSPSEPVPDEDRAEDRVKEDDTWTAPEPTGSYEDPERVTVGQGDDEVTLIDDPEQVRQRWQNVQVGFVDDPRAAIDDAGRLVDEVVELVVTGVAAQRDRLGESWSADDLDTEQLRLALRRYREFLDRLLAV